MINLQIIIKDNGYPEKRITAECFARNYEDGNAHEKAIFDHMSETMYALTTKTMDDLGYGYKDLTKPSCGAKPSFPVGTAFAQPKNTMPRIDHIHMFVSVDSEDGNEGVCAVPMGEIGCMPLIAADDKRLSQLRPIAQSLANMATMSIRLIKLSHREVIETIEPQTGG